MESFGIAILSFERASALIFAANTGSLLDMLVLQHSADDRAVEVYSCAPSASFTSCVDFGVSHPTSALGQRSALACG